MPDFTILSFDSELFGFKVAKILSPRLNQIELQTLLMQLGTQDVRLVYWPSDGDDEITQQAAKQMQGFLGSKQITYAMNLSDLPSNLTKHPEVEFYNDQETHVDLENLAVAAGHYSHFKIDPKFPSNLFLKLYVTWLDNSLNGKLANAVMVVKRGAKIAGMITVNTKKEYGEIGLLAVYPEYRGQNIATHLVRAAQIYWHEHGLTEGKVVTQLANKPACSLYEKCGFHTEKVENFYHFWL